MSVTSLPLSEKIKEKEEEGELELLEEEERVSLLKFFEYLTRKDKILLICGIIAAILTGCTLPAISLVMGNIAKGFTSTDS